MTPGRPEGPDADGVREPSVPEVEPDAARGPGPDAGPAAPPDAPGAAPAASERLTPGGARLRNRPQPEPEPEPEPDPDAPAPLPHVTGMPQIPLKQYYLGVVLMLVGVGLGLYGLVDIYSGRDGDTGGLTLVAAAKVTLGGALAMWGQRVLRVATHDPRAGGRR